MVVRIQNRRGTTVEWLAADPVLLPGELGYEIDENKLKVGNGVNKWSELPYSPDDAPIVADQPPAVRSDGQLWYDTINEVFKRWVKAEQTWRVEGATTFGRIIQEVNGAYPDRPDAFGTVIWVGVDAPPGAIEGDIHIPA